MLLVHLADEGAELGAHDPAERHRVGADHVHLEIARAQRSGHLQADEAGADHDRAPGGLRSGDDGAAVAERAQIVHVRQIARRGGRA